MQGSTFAALALCVLALATAAPIGEADNLALLEMGAGTTTGGGTTTTTGADPTSVTLPALTKEIAERKEEGTNVASKLQAEIQAREGDTVKAAAAASNLQQGLNSEVEARGKAVETTTTAVDAMKTTMQTAEAKATADSAAVTAAVSKLDTALGSEVTNREGEAKTLQTNIDDLKQSNDKAIADAKTELNTAQSKLTTDMSKANKAIETSLQTESQALVKETQQREKQDAETATMIAAMNSKIGNLMGALQNMQQGKAMDLKSLDSTNQATVASETGGGATTGAAAAGGATTGDAATGGTTGGATTGGDATTGGATTGGATTG